MSRSNPSRDAMGKVRTDHPDTAWAAARQLPASGTQRARVLRHIMLNHPGCTDEEIQEALGMNPSTERPRRVELVELGWIEDSGHRRPTRSGATAIVWRYIP